MELAPPPDHPERRLTAHYPELNQGSYLEIGGKYMEKVLNYSGNLVQALPLTVTVLGMLKSFTVLLHQTFFSTRQFFLGPKNGHCNQEGLYNEGLMLHFVREETDFTS